MATTIGRYASRSTVAPRRAKVLVCIGVFVDLAAAGFLIGHLLTLHPVIRALEWPTAASRAAVFVVPAVIALLALVRGPALLATAIVLNFATLIVVPESLVVAPIILLAMLPFVFASIAMRDGEETKMVLGPIIAAVLGIAAAVVLAVGPQRNVEFSLLSQGGRVVRSTATVIASCPSSESGSFSGEGTMESGCDPIVEASAGEIALVISGLAVLAAASVGPRRSLAG